jgi:hypothetical protein
MKSLYLSIFLTALTGTSLAQPFFQLVSEAEYQAQLAYRQPISVNKSLFGASHDGPIIQVRSPSLKQIIFPPIDIDIAFSTTDSAQIDLNSLEVLYGWLNIDITDRIKQHADISSTGLIAKNVVLPKGEHTMTIRIQDDRGRESKFDFAFEVGEPSFLD